MDETSQSPDESAALTTVHVRRAVRGDLPSLGQVVARLSPLLTAVAEYRLGPALRAHVDAEDLVNEAWVIALPRLAGLGDRDGRMTPVLLKFLTTTIGYRVNHLLRAHVTGGRGTVETGSGFAELPSEASGVITQAVRRERSDVLREQLDALSETDREVVMLRGIEQHPSKTVAVLLGIAPAAVDQRYSRALRRLRERLPESVFWELDDA